MKDIQTIALDWLQFTCKGIIDVTEAEVSINENLILKPLKRGSKHFKNCSEIIFYGEKLGEIDYNPRNTDMINTDIIIFKAENNILYQKNFIHTIKEALFSNDNLNFKFKHLKKIDIAIDKPIDDKSELETLIKKVTSKKWLQVGRPDFKPFMQNGEFKALYMGSRQSEKFMRCYYKKSEIAQSNKTYISDFWKRSGMRDSKEVERREFSLKKSYLYRLNDWTLEDLDLLEDAETLASIFKTASEKFFEFISAKEYEKKGAKATRCKRVYTFNFKNLVARLLHKAKRKYGSEIYRMKQAAKYMHFVFKSTKNKIFQAISEEIAYNGELTQWRNLAMRKWDYEYQLFQKSGKFHYLSKYKQLETGQMQLIKANSYV